MSEFVGNINYSWTTCKQHVEGIARQIERLGKSYHKIYGLTRGGLIPAVMLSHRLNVPMETIQWSTRDACVQEISNSFILDVVSQKNLLLVEDIIDGGTTIDTLYRVHGDLLFHKYGPDYPDYLNKYVDIATLIFNVDLDINVDFYGMPVDRTKDKRFFDFEWEKF